VVGGGPAGTAAAVFLRQLGHEVVLVDEARFPRDKICGEGVSPEAWRLLGRMGAEGAVRALRPRPVRGMKLTAPDVLSVGGNAQVNVVDSALQGTNSAISAMGNSKVTLQRTSVTGPQRAGSVSARIARGRATSSCSGRTMRSK